MLRDRLSRLHNWLHPQPAPVVPIRRTWKQIAWGMLGGLCLSSFRSVLKFLLWALPVLAIVVPALIIAAISTYAEESVRAKWDCGPNFAVPCIVEQLHDADSPVVCLQYARGLRVEHVHIRAYGYDSFEVDHTRRTVNVTEIEIQRGIQARDALADLLKHGQLFAEDAHLAVGKVKDDPYGRWLAVLWVRTNDGAWINLAHWAEANSYIREPRHVTRATGGVP